MPDNHYQQVRRAFDAGALKDICQMHEREFADAYDLTQVEIEDKHNPDPFYLFRDNGSSILGVAHLDTVIDHERRITNFCKTADGPVVHSGALDDRLGAFTILELLPMLGVEVDWLLTTGEESGASTAAEFVTDKEYNWAIEFDRGGTDVVLYQYDDRETAKLVSECGAKTSPGAFSDISYLEHLEIKCFNWGVGYHDYHGPRGYAYLWDYWSMIALWLRFHDTNRDVYLPHEKRTYGSKRSQGGYLGYGGGRWGGHWWDREDEYIGVGRDPIALPAARQVAVDDGFEAEADHWHGCLVCSGGPEDQFPDGQDAQGERVWVCLLCSVTHSEAECAA